MATLHIRQRPARDGKFPITLRLRRPGQPELEAEASVEFALTAREQEDLRWYLEDYLINADQVAPVTVTQIEAMMKARGEELYKKVLAHDPGTQALWFAIRSQLADLRIEIVTEVTEAAAIPWELMRDPQSDSVISLRVSAFVRVQSNPNIDFIPVPPADDGRVRILYVVCRPNGSEDVELRTVANRLLQDLDAEHVRARFHIKALRPPTFERLQTELTDAKTAGRPYHIVHFDGHGVYTDLEHTKLKAWLASLSHLMLGGGRSGKHGYLLFEHPGTDGMRPVDGHTLGQLLHDTGAPILVLNACQSAMHEATAAEPDSASVHDEIRAIGSLAQAVIDQGIPAVLGMRYSVYVVTAAQYIGQLYAAMAKGRGFGEAATEGRKHLQRNPERWVGLQPRPLHDWFVPVVYEATPIQLFPAGHPAPLAGPPQPPQQDPVQSNLALLRHVPERGFIGRDETLLALDRAFDTHRVVLLHAYAGQGKTSAAVEFARWYAQTGGLGEQRIVLLASFEVHTDLGDLLNQIAQCFTDRLESRNIHWSALNDSARRRDIVLGLLREAPILWIWDNIEPVAGFPAGMPSQWTPAEQRELHDFLHLIKLDGASQAKVLLTSRRTEQEWLAGIPHRIRLPRLRDTDAARLAQSLAQEHQIPDPGLAEWQPLLDYCQGNPLTLRVLVGQAVRLGLRGTPKFHAFVEAIRSGEQAIEDTDEAQGRDRSLGASLDYGFRHAFKPDELPIIALLHLFQGAVAVDALKAMGADDKHALPELHGKTGEQFTALLERAGETGLLTHIGATYFSIHPALPWFLRQLFARHFDGQAGRSTANAALSAWVEAISTLGNFYHMCLNNGNGNTIPVLAWEEANLIHARRLARRHQWWDPVVSTMQGLECLYTYQGRGAEWSRLVAEIVPDYCTANDEPVAGREAAYTVVMSYRVALARQERDLVNAAALQEKSIAWVRRQTTDLLAMPPDAPPDGDQQNRLRTLSVNVFNLGQILRTAGDTGCVVHYTESKGISRRIGDKSGEATIEFNLGHAYKDLVGIRDLDAAEAAYQRSLDLWAPNDDLRRAGSIKQIGMVHHARLDDAQERKDSHEVQLRHANAAHKRYHEALLLCPKDAPGQLAPIHSSLAVLYMQVGQHDDARFHLEQEARCEEKTGNRHGAGMTRANMAIMYLRIIEQETDPPHQHDYLHRAKAYAEAARLDFQHYQGAAAADESKTQRLLDHIDEALAKLGPRGYR